MTSGSLRGRVALAAALATAVVIMLGGGLVTVLVGRTEHRSLDKRLADQATAVEDPALTAIQDNSPTISVDVASRRPDVGTVIRIYRNDAQLAAVGSTDITFPTPTDGGYSTEPAGGRSWRVLDRIVQPSAAIVDATGSKGPIILQTAVPTSATDELVDNLRQRVLQIAAVSAIIAAVLGRWFGEVAMRPLARLRGTAEQVANSRDLRVRVPTEGGPREVNELANSFNIMLQRLQEAAASTEAALDSSRAFAGNAAHEMRTPLTSMQANLDVLVRNPNLPEEQRDEIVQSVWQEQTRIVGLLDSLHTLARGDVVADAQKEPMDFSDLVGVAVESARNRFPEVEFKYVLPTAETDLMGWRDGLRVLVDNLLVNAARHGGDTAEVSVESRDGYMYLTVDDNGPGIPDEDKNVIFERFGRGQSTRAPGSGLGLALVAQQARMHGGAVSLEKSRLGGARFVVKLEQS